jgi:hypothetical protein
MNAFAAYAQQRMAHLRAGSCVDGRMAFKIAPSFNHETEMLFLVLI